MIRKSVQFAHAVQLRKRGFTYEEIAHVVDVSKSTVSLWLSRETWSKTITEGNQKRASKENSKRISLLNKARSNQNKKLYSEVVRSAVTEYKHYKHNPLFIAGLMLYATNSDRLDNHLIRVTGGRKDTHRIFIKFAIEYLGVSREKIHFWLLLYPEHAPLVSSRSWSKALHIPLSQFYKYQVVESRSKNRTLHDGIGNTIIGGTVLKKKLMKWVELASKEL